MNEIWVGLDSACKDCDLSRYGYLFWDKVPEAKVTYWNPFDDFLVCFHHRVQTLQHRFSSFSITKPCHLSCLIPPPTRDSSMCGPSWPPQKLLYASGFPSSWGCCLFLLSTTLFSDPRPPPNSSFRPQLLWHSSGEPLEFPKVECTSLHTWAMESTHYFVTALQQCMTIACWHLCFVH